MPLHVVGNERNAIKRSRVVIYHSSNFQDQQMAPQSLHRKADDQKDAGAIHE